MSNSLFFSAHPFIAGFLAFALALAMAIFALMIAALFYWAKGVNEFKRVMHIMEGAEDPTDEAGA